jgi:hypothetical protein
MKRSDLEPLIGKVVCLDMINRERPVCRVVEVTDVDVLVKNPMIFIPVPAGESYQVQGISYAAPLFEVKTLRVGYDHIVALLDVPSQMEQAYVRNTSGIVTDTTPKIIVP